MVGWLVVLAAFLFVAANRGGGDVIPVRKGMFPIRTCPLPLPLPPTSASPARISTKPASSATPEERPRNSSNQ
jgi:hypothetical protein